MSDHFKATISDMHSPVWKANGIAREADILFLSKSAYASFSISGCSFRRYTCVSFDFFFTGVNSFVSIFTFENGFSGMMFFPLQVPELGA